MKKGKFAKKSRHNYSFCVLINHTHTAFWGCLLRVAIWLSWSLLDERTHTDRLAGIPVSLAPAGQGLRTITAIKMLNYKFANVAEIFCVSPSPPPLTLSPSHLPSVNQTLNDFRILRCSQCCAHFYLCPYDIVFSNSIRSRFTKWFEIVFDWGCYKWSGMGRSWIT